MYHQKKIRAWVGGALLASFILAGLLSIPGISSALSVPWDRPSVGRINPLYILDTVFGNIFNATSTTQASIFPYASTTAISWTATSTGTNGLNISAGCFAVNGVCLISDSSNLTGGGVTGMMTAWSSATNLIATSTIVGGQFISTSTTLASSFPLASTTLLTVSTNQWLTALATAAGAFLAVDTNGKIIATTSPTTGGGVVGAGTTGQNAYYSALNTVTGTSTIFTSLASFVGIGTTTPRNLFDIENNANAQTIAEIRNTNTGTGAFAGYAVGNDYVINNGLRMLVMGTGWTTSQMFLQDSAVISAESNLSNGLSIATRANAPIRFYTNNNNERVRFDEAGNVGIATTSPATTLSVGGNGYFTGFLGAGLNPTSSFKLSVGGDSTTNLLAFIVGGAYKSSIGTGSSFGTATAGSDLSFRSDAGAMVFGFSGTETARFSTNGNVGISTTSPGSLLSVGNTTGINFTTATSTFATGSGINLTGGCYAISGNCVTGAGTVGAGTTGQVAYYNGTNTVIGTSTLFIHTNSFVGIGTTTPDNQLTLVRNGASATAVLYSYGVSGTSNSPQIDLRAAGGTVSAPTAVVSGDRLGDYFFTGFNGSTFGRAAEMNSFATENFVSGSNQGANLTFQTTANGGTTRSEKVRITGDGKLGVGTTSPSQLLSVAGSGYFTGGVGVGLVNTTAGSLQTLNNITSGGVTTGTGGVVSNVDVEVNPAGFLLLLRNVAGTNRIDSYNSPISATVPLNFDALNMAFQIADVTKMVLDGSGNLGVGTASPLAQSQVTIAGRDLSVTGADTDFTAGGARAFMDLGGTAARMGVAGGTGTQVQFWINTLEPMMINSSGKVGIATTTPEEKLSILDSNNWNPLYGSLLIDDTGAIGAGLTLRESGNSGRAYSLLSTGSSANSGAGKLAFFDSTASAYRMVIDSTGLVGIATTSPWRTFSVVGTAAMPNLTTSAGLQTGVVCVASTGELINDSVACIASSERYKEQIKTLGGSLDEVMALHPVSFKYKPSFNGALQSNPNYNGAQLGLIAEEVAKIDPRLVIVDATGTTPTAPAGVRYENLTALLTGAIQQVEQQILGIFKKDDTQDAQIKALQVTVAEQAKEIKSLEAKIK